MTWISKLCTSAVCLSLFACCTDSLSVGDVPEWQIVAEAGIGTKVSVGGDLSLFWNQDDKVALLAVAPGGTSAESELTVYTVDSGFNRAMFKGSVSMTEAPQTCHFAFPSSAVLSEDGAVTFSCASQTGIHSPFLYGTSAFDATSMEVLMEQAGGMIHLTNPSGIVSVTVRGNASEPISKFSVREGVVTFPADALNEFTVHLNGTDNYIAMPPVNFSRGFSLVFNREDGARMFKSYSSDGGETSGYDFSAGRFVEISVTDFVETSVSASVTVTHTVDGSGNLDGSDAKVSSFSVSGVTSKIVTGCGIELYVQGQLARSIETASKSFAGGELLDVVSGWPFLPSSTAVTMKPYCLVSGEKVYGEETPVDVPSPAFTASVSGYTSYTLFRGGDVSGANAFTDASAIKGVGASVGISEEILGNPNYAGPSVSFATDKGKSLEPVIMTSAAYSFGEWGGHPWDTSNLTATVIFDGVAVTSASVPCVITGLPYSVDFNTQPSEWSVSSNTSWESGLKLGGGTGSANAQLESSRIYVPDGESLDVNLEMKDITMRTIAAGLISNRSVLEARLGSSNTQLLKGPSYNSFGTKDEYHSSVSKEGALSSADKRVVLTQTQGEAGCYCTIGSLTLKYR